MSDTPSPLLHHEFLAADGVSPTRWLYMLHGIFGSGRNWGSLARRLVRARPEWGVVLVDLREHGASEGFPPPHTVDACAADLVALAGSTGRPVDALLGHSFGGKVALAFADGGGAPAQLWVVDSTPDTGRAGGTAWQMLEHVKGLPDHFGSRDELVDRLAEVGISQPVARWMATNLQGDPTQGYRWRFNLAAIEELLLDFFTRDLWNVLESPPQGTEIHLIRALQSSVLSESAIGRIQGMEGKGTVFLHPVEGGHWVNADNPDALHDLLTAGLPGR